jgi:hypothetical protein
MGASLGTTPRVSLKAILRCNSEKTGRSTPIINPTSLNSGPAALMTVELKFNRLATLSQVDGLNFLASNVDVFNPCGNESDSRFLVPVPA